MEMIILTTLSVLTILLSLLALFCSLYAIIEVKAIQKSTHQIQYVGAPYPGTQTDNDGFEIIDEEMKKKFETTEDDGFGNMN